MSRTAHPNATLDRLRTKYAPPRAEEQLTPSADSAATRTYRYLRISMVASVVAIFVAVGVVSGDYAELIPTISHFFYTPAGVVFTGALIAAAAAMLAISGGGTQQVLLDIAGMLAPIIALVPANATNAFLENVGLEPCPASDLPPTEIQCVPHPFDDFARVGMTVWFVLVPTLLILAIAVHVAQRLTDPARHPTTPRTLIATQILGWAIFAAYLVWWFAFNEGFLATAHYVTASAFFVVISLVALWQAFVGPLRTREQIAAGDPPTLPQRIAGPTYVVIAVVLALVLLAGLGMFVGLIPVGANGMFWVETVGLSAFAAFWLTQTIQKWKVIDA